MKIIQPKRQEHSVVQIWHGTPAQVFPLLCPVRETDWIPDWDPKLVVSNSGLMERDCIFIEAEGSSDAIWVVTGYEPERWLEIYRTVPEATVSRFSIAIEPEPEGHTRATITYAHTAIGAAGEPVVDEFTAQSFAEFMQHFAAAIQHYLTTGRMIAAA